MKRFNNILICGHPDRVDLKLLEHAAEIAKAHQARIKVVHTITDYPKDVRTWWNVRNPGMLRDKIIREREEFLDGLVESLETLGVERISKDLLWGEPAVEITKQVLHDQHDLVMLVSKHRGKASHSIHGYPSMDLLRQCPSPIWITKKKVKPRKHRVVACLGGSGGEVKIADTNAKILDHAATVARAQGSEIQIIHVMPHYGDQKKVEKHQLNHDLTAYLDNVRAEIKIRANEFLAEYDSSIDDAQVHILIGTPTTVIPEFIELKGADLVVMATAARSGLPGMIVGNAAEKVLKRISCPLLVVKSDSFNAQFNTKEAEENSSTA
ncbi:MAG: universal stress protein [Gammaproteobacteria bacterium]|nr:universal stress protein [Gammaproteobacteria bacterium]